MLTMAEYIEREALIKSFNSEVCNFIYSEPTVKAIISRINSQPTADVVPVVRCKDCRYWNKTDTDIIVNIDYGKCTNSNSPYHNEEETTGGDYCSYGERRCGE